MRKDPALLLEPIPELLPAQTGIDSATARMNRLTLRDEKQIDDWIDELGGLTKHKEAARVYFLLHLIALGNDAGLL